MPKLHVGGFYGQPRRWPEGLIVTGLSAERSEIILSYTGLTAQQVEDWRAAPITVSLTPFWELLIVSLEDAFGMSDGPYHILAGAEGERTPMKARYNLTTFILMAAETGRIRALRSGTLSPEFSRLVGEGTARQLEQRAKFTHAAYTVWVNQYLSTSTTRELMRQAVITERLGLTEPPEPPSVDMTQIKQQLAVRYPTLDSRVHEVMAEVMASGAAHIEVRGGADWWVDPEFGEDTPVLSLGYDETLGMVDTRRQP